MRYLGLDLGSKTLGVALSDTTNTIASSLKTIFFKEDDYNSLIEPIRELVNEYNISKIVLGLPKNMNNTLGPRAEISYSFKKLLEDNLNIEVILEDERLTTVISNNIMIKADMSRKKRKKKVDSIAASLILQSYLDRRI
ncbi:MAG: Holliday junction resolvase RuvX [Bacilli bacterium]|nr:Holliday junction resolvase RuvX [Bacilli bacterium]